MQPFRYHVLACDQHKPEGVPCCNGRNAAAVLDALRKELGARGLLDEVQVTVTGSIGLCERGPNWVVYPDGVWYSGVTLADVPEIVHDHFQRGRPVERLMNHDVAAVKREITEQRGKMMAAFRARDEAGVVPDELTDMIRGFQASRVVLSAIELDMFSAVAENGDNATAAATAARLGTDPRSTEVLLNALVALSLLTKRDGKYANAPLARRYLVRGERDDARDALKHSLSLWNTWSTLSERVKTGHVAAFRDMGNRGESWTVPFIAAMHRNAAMRAPLVVRTVGAAGVGRVLDVGGGSGAFSIAFAQANPTLQAEVLDLATVTPIAAKHVAEAGLSDRVHVRVGDLRKDALGEGYDLVLLSAICHMLGPDENQDLLRRAHAALSPGGRIAIQDHVMNEEGTLPRAGAMFAVNMLVGTPDGCSFRESQYQAWLVAAGFRDVRHVPLPGPNDIMLATKG
jgi:(2Fe-2S) ferredoxin/2-polyprenyl-3-methyl-5-hydroxy-6-metoxy-1,4-benzoquinol methylase